MISSISYIYYISYSISCSSFISSICDGNIPHKATTQLKINFFPMPLASRDVLDSRRPFGTYCKPGLPFFLLPVFTLHMPNVIDNLYGCTAGMEVTLHDKVSFKVGWVRFYHIFKKTKHITYSNKHRQFAVPFSQLTSTPQRLRWYYDQQLALIQTYRYDNTLLPRHFHFRLKYSSCLYLYQAIKKHSVNPSTIKKKLV